MRSELQELNCKPNGVEMVQHRLHRHRLHRRPMMTHGKDLNVG